MADHYFAVTGSGSGTGADADNPQTYSTSNLTTAEAAASSGDTIYFMSGDYALSGTQTFDADGITYRSYELHGAKLYASGFTDGSSYPLMYLNNNTNSVGSKFHGLVIENYTLSIGGPSDLTVVEANQPAITQCKLNYPNYSTSSSYIFNNTQSGASTRKWRLENSTIFANYAGVRPFNVYGDATNQVPVFNNCSIYFDLTQSTGITERSDAEGTHTNCIFSSNDNSKVAMNYSNNSTNCCFHNMGTTNQTGGTNNISGDPLFVDDSGNDLRLRPNSPCINAGTVI